MLKFSDQIIAKASLPAGAKDRLLFDGKRPGLGLRITAAGSKIFLHQWRDRATGTKRRETLGIWPTLTLEKARRAVEIRAGKIADGHDPAAELAARKAAADEAKLDSALTFDRLIDDWQRLYLTGRRARYAFEAPRALRYGLRPLLKRSVRKLDRADVLRLLDGMVKGGRVSMAHRTAGYGAACFNWAIKRGTLTKNPFALLPLEKGNGSRERFLSDAEIAAVWRTAEANGDRFGALVRLMLLTGARREEAGAMAWSEISDDLATWTLPGARTKNGHTHVLPLVEPLREILRTAPRTGRFVWGGVEDKKFSSWDVPRYRLEKASGVTGWTLHDLRRTLATGLQKLGVRLEVTEAVLNHVGGSRAGIVGVYQRHDWAAEKRAALDAWAKHVTDLAAGKAAAGNVVALRSA